MAGGGGRRAQHLLKLNQVLDDLEQDSIECYAAACPVVPVRAILTHGSESKLRPQPSTV